MEAKRTDLSTPRIVEQSEGFNSFNGAMLSCLPKLERLKGAVEPLLVPNGLKPASNTL